MRKSVVLLIVSLLFIQGVFSRDKGLLKMTGKTISQTPSEIVFSDLRYLKQDRWGNVFALDAKKSRIVKYDNNLKYITAFGREGKGPGEFTSSDISTKDILTVTPDGDVWIADFNPERLVVYSNDGKPKKELRMIDIKPSDLNKNFYDHNPLTNNVFAALALKNVVKNYLEDPVEEFLIIRINPSKVLFRADTGEKRIKMEYKGYWVIGQREDYFGDSAKASSNGKIACVMISQRYEVWVCNLETGASHMIKKDYKSGAFKENELEMLRKERENTYKPVPGMCNALMDYLKPRKNTLMDVQFSHDKILVFPTPEDITVTNNYVADVWDAGGKFLYSVHFPFRPVHINGDMVYTVERNEADDPVIVRWKTAL